MLEKAGREWRKEVVTNVDLGSYRLKQQWLVRAEYLTLHCQEVDFMSETPVAKNMGVFFLFSDV